MQVKNQIMDLIKKGHLKVGYKMPTERELAQKLRVSRNTISTSYNELEQEGVLKSYQGKGTFVAEEAISWKDQNIRKRIVKFVDLGLEEALEIGIDPDSFLEIVIQRVKEKKDIMNKLVASYVECNIEQARMFSQQLNKISNMNVIPITLNDLKNMDKETKEKLEKTQVIIATFNHVNEVVELIKDTKKEVLGVAINPNIETIVKIARYTDGTKFGFVCISEEFMFKVKGALEGAGLGNIIDIQYSNSKDKEELAKLIDKSDVMIVSPGRYKEIKELNKDNKDIIEFLYDLDNDSVKALKSKIIEFKNKNI
ncbi:GntR family transcriptional regulator [Haloimpatiens sp. FM7330]|uniref:GntR family transcriptional regulator n=1 Tax=Haloimpatiens sp. FM7330 TaxID=3298610 RepID=UPI00362D672E